MRLLSVHKAVLCCACLPGHSVAASAQDRAGPFTDHRSHILFELCGFLRSHKPPVAFRHIPAHFSTCIICHLLYKVGLHERPAIRHCLSDQRHMIRTDRCPALSHRCHHNL